MSAKAAVETAWITTNYPGADTFLGHSELMGISSRSELGTVASQWRRITSALARAGFSSEYRDGHIVVAGRAFVLDNLECDPATNINVVAAQEDMDEVSFQAISEVVREAVRNPRVIAIHGSPLSAARIAAEVKALRRGGWEISGASIPALGVYNEYYRVRHLALGLPEDNLVSRLRAGGATVALIGKAPDVIPVEADLTALSVDPNETLEDLMKISGDARYDYVICNFQQIDLAGHGMDLTAAAEHLRAVDRTVDSILARVEPGVSFALTADHGNDPCVNGGMHTRENLPFVMVDPTRSAEWVNWGHRHSLGWIADLIWERRSVVNMSASV
ncbi:alkaline phosphatase family protein [Promicromonospora sp. MS192]|uniref:alkaline phosphatase family protein n=1 Tax=Promicromonospora sp. MS192 TaxID=3412684 RepID=UPI003C2E65AA